MKTPKRRNAETPKLVPHRRMVKLALLTALLATGFPTLTGCQSESGPQAKSKPIEKVVKQGGATLRVLVDRDQVGVADPFKLTVEVTCPEGLTVQMPTLEGKVGGFNVRSKAQPPAIPVSQGRLHLQQYTLESMSAGQPEIPAFRVQVEKSAGSATQPAATVLTSEPFQIKVASLVSDPFDPAKFRDIKGTVELPYERDRSWLWGAIALGVVSVAALGMTLYLRRRAKALAIPADQWALRELGRLLELQLLEKGALEEFYLRLSGIVRQYIERKFGLKAPERTTPEFLIEMRTTPALLAEHKVLLGEFLEAADMVKFAKFAPTRAEVENAVETARKFIVQSTAAYVQFKKLEVAA